VVQALGFSGCDCPALVRTLNPNVEVHSPCLATLLVLACVDDVISLFDSKIPLLLNFIVHFFSFHFYLVLGTFLLFLQRNFRRKIKLVGVQNIGWLFALNCLKLK
jgi:hypothetical protein